ncbi:YtxH domain-containing protein [Fibrella sp. HMF5335]|uniref:YtxH domain-containing protein n=1 Tax=Fibrella rubiginis TaxID=2817060 RepID=A0A939K309_9BACT|nr:YtxH domain-containing protein [Fibrella rubiginis]MBO0936879.1 YtxH domain-containing protein [Fibrella rubiginis]
MKKIIYTAAFVAACSATAVAQNTTPSSTSPADTTRPLINERTKENVREKANEVKQEVKEKSREIKQDVKEKAGEVKQDVNQAADKAKEKVQEEYEVSRSYQQRNALAWFDKGSYMASINLGVGTGAGSGTYLSLRPQVGYFFQPGLMGGIRLGFDRRLSTSYHANQTGVFLRYYPFRTRISGFGGFGYNIGREYSSNIGADQKARYNSVNLEIGTMFWVRPNFGAELALENNYYDQSDPLAGRNKGGRFRFGVNYFFGRPNR